jgi:hypothetical protein
MANETTLGAVQPPQRRTDELLARLAERVGARFDASSVFGNPVERDGVTVISVATTRFGLAGGAGSDPRKARTARVAARPARRAPPATSSSKTAAAASSPWFIPSAWSCWSGSCRSPGSPLPGSPWCARC